MSGLQLAFGLVVYAIGRTLQGVLGFGGGLFAVPILALIHPDFVPGPVLRRTHCSAGCSPCGNAVRWTATASDGR